MQFDAQQLADGIRLHQAGRIAEALTIYRQALAADSDNADLLSLAGAAYVNLRLWNEAQQHLEAAVRLNPRHAAAHENLGVLWAAQKQYALAVDSFRQAAQHNPASAGTWLNLAHALVRAGDNPQALHAFDRAVALDPNLLKAQQERARLSREAGRAVELLDALRAIARLQPNDPRAHFALAAALAEAGKLDEAIAAYETTLRLKPDSVEACVNLSQAFSAQRRFAEAAAAAERAVQLRPRFAEALANLGSALIGLGRSAEAEPVLREAVRLKPALAEAHNNLGIALADLGQTAAAMEEYRAVLTLRPGDADAHHNLGIALIKQGQPQQAIVELERALVSRPQFAEAHHNRSAALLLLGQFEQGFAEYEWRFGSRDFPPLRLRWPLWRGEELAGRTIVLCAEQGLGDTIQFVRYAPLLQRLGARVVVACSAVLHPLLERTPGVDAWIAPKQPCQADYALPMLSAPHRLATRLETIPADTPYVFADPQRVAAWQTRLSGLGGFRVGIVWQGNAKCPGDAQRSIALRHFAPLAELPGVQLVSLQKGPGAEQLEEFKHWPVLSFGDQLDAAGGAFMDTAAIMQSLDLVISSDTAAAHLAGALRVPVWAVLQAVPDWRWMLDRDDSPWYPEMRLFRQPSPGDWSRVFQQVAEQLGRLAASTDREPTRR